MNSINERYAKALFQISVGAGNVKNHLDALLICRDKFNNMPKGLFQNPLIRSQEKHKIIETIFGDEADYTIVNFIKLLCDNMRIEEISDIYDAYYRLTLEHDAILEATLKYVAMPTEAELSSIKVWLAKEYNKADVLLHLIEDKSLIGGIRLKVGDTVYDKSIKKVMKTMGNSLKSR